MLRELIELHWKIKKINESYPKWNKAKYSGSQQWKEGNQDLNQWFGTKGRNKHPAGTEWRNKNSKKWRESYKPLGQPEMFQYQNYWSARRRRTIARNWKLIWTNNSRKLPKSGEGNRLPGSPGSPIPKKLDPKRNTPRHITIKLPRTKDKEKILNEARGKKELPTKECP